MKLDKETFVESFQGKGYAGNLKTFDKGHLGLGDPDDKTLNDMEIKVLVPCWEKDIIIRDYCNNENKEYETCRGDSYFFNRFYTCSEQKSNLNNCIEYWKNRLDLREQATAEYLEERRIYRSTGLSKIERENELNAKESTSNVLVSKIRSFLLKDEEMKQYEENIRSTPKEN